MAEKGFKRKLTAILSADVVGYSRLMGEDEEATVRTLTAYREVLTTLIQQHNGKVLDSPGDNLLAEFVSVVDGVQCAVAVQKEIKARNDELPENRRMQFRIGINLGDVIQEEERIYGDGVNIAARLEALADPGGICVSKTAFDHIEAKLPLGYEFLGEQAVKNISKPVGAYRVLMEPRVTVAGVQERRTLASLMGRKSVTSGVIAVLVVIICALVWNSYLRAPKIEPASVERMSFELPDKPSIAVLPFKNLSDDPKQEYLSDGISEAIINALSKLPRVFVIARNSSFNYKGKSVKAQQVAEELGVQYILEGSVQRSGEKLRVTAQLIDALKGHHLWSEQYDLKMDDLLTVQDMIAMNVLVETQVTLTDGEQMRMMKKATNNLKAYEKFLEAVGYYHRTNREDNFKARQLAEEAIGLDPNFSTAYVLVGVTHFWDSVRGWSQDRGKSWQLATDYTQKALALDESDTGALRLWCSIVQGNGDNEKAIEIARRAIEINPNNASSYEALAGVLFNAGYLEEAIPLYEKAGRLNPFPPARYYRNAGLFYWFAGRYEDAIVASKKALHIDPEDVTTFRNLAAIYMTIGEEEKARAAAAEVLRLNPDFSIEHHFKNIRWEYQEGQERFIDALCKAGLK
jgi:adenylate cyclase